MFENFCSDIIQTMKCYALESFNLICQAEHTKINSRLNFKPGLALIAFWTTRPSALRPSSLVNLPAGRTCTLHSFFCNSGEGKGKCTKASLVSFFTNTTNTDACLETSMQDTRFNGKRKHETKTHICSQVVRSITQFMKDIKCRMRFTFFIFEVRWTKFNG